MTAFKLIFFNIFIFQGAISFVEAKNFEVHPNILEKYNNIQITRDNSGHIFMSNISSKKNEDKKEKEVEIKSNKFEFNYKKKDNNSNVKEKPPTEKKIIVTGYGISKQKALQNAFKSAIEQYIGVIVDSEIIMKNGKIIKDNILTASNGFIKKYDELSMNREDGLVEVKINATVRSQKLFNKIKKLNMATLSIKNSKDFYAEAFTKVKNKRDSAKLLKKTIENFISEKSLQEMFLVQILNVEVNEAKITTNNEGEVPITIDYSLSINKKIYNQKVKMMEQVFQNLGAKLFKRVDLPSIKYPQLVRNYKKVLQLTKTDFGIVKIVGKMYILDVWRFPSSWSNIYPFNQEKELNFNTLFKLVISIKDEKNNTLYENYLESKNYGLLLEHIGQGYTRYMNYWEKGISNYYSKWRKDTIKIISPLFNLKVNKEIISNLKFNKFNIVFSHTSQKEDKLKAIELIELDMLGKMKDITITVEIQ